MDGRPVITAITGGIAEGKSTVLRFIASMGYSTASADDVARLVFEDGEVNGMLAEIAGMLAPISRSALRDVLFKDPSARRAVNRVMHPRIIDAISQLNVEFVEVPLLIEGCLQGSFDKIWVVTCGLEEQHARLKARYGATTDVDAILAMQLPTSAKLPFADLIIRTNREPQTVSRFVSEALQVRID